MLDNARFPVLDGFLHRRGGKVRNDAVPWAYARSARARGQDILEWCEVTGIRVEAGRVAGVETGRGTVRADKVFLCVAAYSSRLAAMARCRLPIAPHLLHAVITETVKPCADVLVTYRDVHFYVSQSDKGGLMVGGATDCHNRCAQSILRYQVAFWRPLLADWSNFENGRDAGAKDATVRAAERWARTLSSAESTPLNPASDAAPGAYVPACKGEIGT